MDELYQSWRKKPTPEGMGQLLDAANPTIDAALKSYAGGNQALRSRARQLAVGAFQSYDPNKGTKLTTHLMTQLHPLTRYARQREQVTHIPERVTIDAYRMRQEEQKFRDIYRRDPSDKELSGLMNVPTRRLTKLRRYGAHETAESSLTEMDEGEAATMYPGVQKADPAMVWMEFVHHDLGPVDQKILEWKTGYNGAPMLSNNEIARKLNLTAGAVSQRSARIAKRLAEGEGLAV